MVSCTRTTSWHPYLPPTKLTLKVFGQILGDPKGFAVAGAAESPTHMRTLSHLINVMTLISVMVHKIAPNKRDGNYPESIVKIDRNSPR